MFVVIILGIVLSYLMYAPVEPLKALFAGATSTLILNTANLKALKGEN